MDLCLFSCLYLVSGGRNLLQSSAQEAFSWCTPCKGYHIVCVCIIIIIVLSDPLAPFGQVEEVVFEASLWHEDLLLSASIGLMLKALNWR